MLWLWKYTLSLVSKSNSMRSIFSTIPCGWSTLSFPFPQCLQMLKYHWMHLVFQNFRENWWELQMDPKSKPFSQPPPQSTDHGVCIFHFSHGQNRALIHSASKSQPNYNFRTWNILINYVLSKKTMHGPYELISTGKTNRHKHIQLWALPSKKRFC